MATHHPYSFTDPTEPTVARRRSFQLSDERGRVAAGDSEAPATARDWELEREESRAPLLIAGVTSAVILGGLLVVLGFAAGEPQLSTTIETETTPRQAAQLERIDAAALDRYQRWRGLDTFMVSLATDGLTRIYGIRGKTASKVRRFGMGLINRIGPAKDRLMAEARGTSGDLPLLLRGLPI